MNRYLRFQSFSYLNAYTSLYGVDCSILEHFPFDPTYYSHKIKIAALRNEMGLSIAGKILRASGPYPAGRNSDINMVRNGMKNSLLSDERVRADGGYQNENCMFLSRILPRHRHFCSQVRARYETINSRLKTFNVLAERFRHDSNLHDVCFHAFLQLTQINLEIHPLFYI